MAVYTPDAWVCVRITSAEETIDKVLAGWYGGLAGSDSWKLNSGITAVRDVGDAYEFDGHSGSTYVCAKHAERVTLLTGSVLASMDRALAEDGGSAVRIAAGEVRV